MPKAHANATFDGALSNYVERGYFRSLKESQDGNVHVYRFDWLSEFHQITLTYDTQERALTLVRLFPAVPDNAFDHLDAQVTKRSDPESKLPEHKRIDPALGAVSLVREESAEEGKDGDASLRLDLAPDGDDAEALQTLVKLANDLIFDLQLRFAGYTYDHFAQINE